MRKKQYGQTNLFDEIIVDNFAGGGGHHGVVITRIVKAEEVAV